MVRKDGQTPGTLAIFAGGGEIPKQVVRAADSLGRALFILGMKDVTDPTLEAWPLAWLKWGEFGRMLKLLKANHCTEIVLIGKVQRPHIKDIKFDFGALAKIPKLLSMMAGGDGDVLNALVQAFEQNGIQVIGAHQVAPELCLTEKNLGRHSPDRAASKDIQVGLDVARKIGALDIGQGVIVDSCRIVAVEAAEGTDEMIARSGMLRLGKRHGRSGVLVKVPKPGQDLRVDMPTIGVATIEGLARAGFAGIAVERGHTLVVEKEAVRAVADKTGLFVTTVPPQD
ncbi:MAG: UDP-2,3-diacylglucosamine diphosphatase LpxI [Fimbriimonadaceae bacterium]|nr:UDP-2,3-diacylglucosamine diphosphatase LpxI [Alphaproteobacteria bacterium]